MSALLLALLSLFQISEWFICQGAADAAWSRIGFVATAFLPVIGLDLIFQVTKRHAPAWLGYACAAAFSFVFVFLPEAFTGAACTGKFVVFHGGTPALNILYGSYYILTLFLGVFLIMRALQTRRGSQEALVWLLVGYLSFMLPTFALYALVMTTRIGFSSILCGFAILLALIHVVKVLPAVEKR